MTLPAASATGAASPTGGTSDSSGASTSFGAAAVAAPSVAAPTVPGRTWLHAVTPFVAAAALLGVLMILPFLLKNYRVFQLTLVLVYAIAILGLNLLTGYNGQISLGHGAFYAAGAYVAAILMDRYDVPYWSTLPAAFALCLVIGFLMGFPALRLGGLYLALATFALAVAMPQMLKWKGISSLTGGVQGIVLSKPDAPFEMTLFGESLTPDRWLYLFTLLIAALMFWLASNLVCGRVGRALVAIRDHPIAASAMGINLPFFKSLTFGVSAAFTGVAGALGAIAVGFVAPDSFHAFLSLSLLVGVVVGGLGTVWGAVLGAAFIQFVPNIADDVSKSAPAAIYGVLLIALMYLAPRGVMGILGRLFSSRHSGA